MLIDCEHGNITDNEMYLAVAAIASAGSSPIVRIPADEPWMMKRALDSGAHGIMIPMCETKVKKINKFQTLQSFFSRPLPIISHFLSTRRKKKKKFDANTMPYQCCAGSSRIYSQWNEISLCEMAHWHPWCWSHVRTVEFQNRRTQYEWTRVFDSCKRQHNSHRSDRNKKGCRKLRRDRQH